MEIIVIEAGSKAFERLRRAFADPETYGVRLEVRRDGLAVKVNGGMWTPALETANPHG